MSVGSLRPFRAASSVFDWGARTVARMCAQLCAQLCTRMGCLLSPQHTSDLAVFCLLLPYAGVTLSRCAPERLRGCSPDRDPLHAAIVYHNCMLP